MINVITETSSISNSKTGILKAGNPISQTNDIVQIISEAGFNWEVSKRPLATSSVVHPLLFDKGINPTSIDPYPSESMIPIKEYYAIVRNDTNHPLGIVGSEYTPINNFDSMSMFETLISDKTIIVQRAGLFGGGTNAWVIAYYPKEIKIVKNGREIQLHQYFLLGWSHNGTESLHSNFISYTSDGVVVNPSLPHVKNSFAIRHTKNSSARIKIVTDIVKHGNNYFNALGEKVQEFVNAEFTYDNMSKFLEEFFGDNDSKQSERSRCEIREIFLKENDPSKWGAFKSASLWAEECRSTRNRDNSEEVAEEKKLKSIWTGSISGLKNKAFTIINSI